MWITLLDVSEWGEGGSEESQVLRAVWLNRSLLEKLLRALEISPVAFFGSLWLPGVVAANLVTCKTF